MKNFEEIMSERKIRRSLLSEEFLEMIQKNKRPFDLLMSYYQCAVMEIETKFRVLNQEYSLEYDKNPIEGIKTRIKSYDSIVRKIRRKNIPMSLTAIEENIKDIAGVRVICSFPEDIYELADSFLRQDDIVLIEKKDYIKNPKPSGYRSLHLIVQVPIFLQKNKKMVNVEVQFRTIAMDFWASLEHKLRYKKDIPADQAQQLQEELLACATQSSIWLVSHWQIQPCFFVYNTLIVGEGMKTVFAMVGTHSAFTKAAKSHLTGCQVDDGVIDTSASESTAGSNFFRSFFVGGEDI